MCSLKRVQFAVNGNPQRSADRYTLHPLASRPQVQRKNLLNDDDVIRDLRTDSLKTPSALNQLSSRREEISHWQGRISFVIDQVDKETTALKQVKHGVEGYLQDVQTYSQYTMKSVVLRNSVNPIVMRQDSVFTELQNEQQQTERIRQDLQKQIRIVEDKLSSLSKIRAQLHSDVLDKREAIKLTAECIAHPVKVFHQHQPKAPHKFSHVSYGQWLSHCKHLKLVAEEQIQISAVFRVKLRNTLPKLRNAQKDRHRCITDSLKKIISQLTKSQQRLVVEKKQAMEKISCEMKHIQRIADKITSCKSKLQEVNRRLYILNQRPGYERCWDHPYNSLIKEKYAWTKKIDDLQEPLKQSEKNLQHAERRPPKLEDKMSENAQALEMLQDCLYQHEWVTPSLVNTARLTNRPKVFTRRF